ncbi:MAG TPA: hypothetical protein VKA03_02425 [Methylovirgula sp.]|nr:hypothetical protein [Methylovirgula sp.]
MFDLVWRPGLAFAGIALIAAFTLAGEARAESVQKQCSDKYQAAKAANSLNGQTWNQFYKQCAAELKGAPEAAPSGAAAPAAPEAKPTATQAPPAQPAQPAATTAAPKPTGPIVFPTAISPQYASDKPGKAREKTCLDQYHANKATNSNGGLRWIEKGDGYYSLCNKKLKGGA